MEKDLLERFVDGGGSIREIARELKTSPTSIRYWLKKHGLSTYHKNFGSRKKWTDEQMREAIGASDSIAECLRRLDLKVRPGNYETVRRFVKANNISLAHMTGKKHGKGGFNKLSLEEIMVEDSSYRTNDLKKRLIKEGEIEEVCEVCGMGPEWNGKKLVLILDHRNGIRNDHRRKNLRLVCPNCNSQLPTHCRGKSGT